MGAVAEILDGKINRLLQYKDRACEVDCLEESDS